MSTQLGWHDVLLRLTLSVIAGTLIGLNRGEQGHPAGLRTTLLVCLAAAVSMIQTNLLLATAGKPSDSFVTLDLMRLPLGILTGMGFIGGGVILKKGDVIIGVTTAATLWFVTVIGLCLGGGQIVLGSAALVLGLVVLTGLKWVESLVPQYRRATLTLTAALEGPTEEMVLGNITERGFLVSTTGVRYINDERKWTLCCELRWRARLTDPAQPALAKELAQLPGVSHLEWKPQGLSDEFGKDHDGRQNASP